MDVCRECGGVWLDRGELESLMRMGREALSRSSAGEPRRSFHFQGRPSRRSDSDLLERGGYPGSDSRPYGSGHSVDRYPSGRLRPAPAGDQGRQGRRYREEDPLRRGLSRLWDVLEDLFK